VTERRHDTVDSIDREIIRLLQRNGRTSNTEIGRALGRTETTIRKRIARLLDEGLVTIVAVPSPRAVGTTMSAIIGVSVDLRQIESASKTLASLAEVRYLGLSTGRYDIILEAFFTDTEHLLTFVSERLGTLPEVTGIETSIILRVDKFSYEWELPLD
jgi:Lrp/AsnC family transcriptional regulator for asnA, asnC and gidA